MSLAKQSDLNNKLASVEEATGFYARLMGLMFRRSYPSGQALWFRRCNTIQTTFMRFDIDAVFVDREMVVQKVFHSLKPWRVTMPRLKFDSVFEFTAGQVEKLGIQEGDKLYVGH